jgi:hypothetical protein
MALKKMLEIGPCVKARAKRPHWQISFANLGQAQQYPTASWLRQATDGWPLL